jgi:hypothetical protein
MFNKGIEPIRGASGLTYKVTHPRYNESDSRQV